MKMVWVSTLVPALALVSCFGPQKPQTVSKRSYLQNQHVLQRQLMSDGQAAADMLRYGTQTLCSNRGTENAGSNVKLAQGIGYKLYDVEGAAVKLEINDPALAVAARSSILDSKQLTLPKSIPDGSYFVAICDTAKMVECAVTPEFVKKFGKEFKNLKKGTTGVIGGISNLTMQGGAIASVTNAAVLLKEGKQDDKPGFLFGRPDAGNGGDGASNGSSGTSGNPGDDSSSGLPAESPSDGATTSIPGDEVPCDEVSSPLMVDFSPAAEIRLSAPSAGADFDINGDGKKERISWPLSASTMFLVLDRNGNGAIDDVHELFGNNTVGPDGKKAANGFEALRKYDDNNDGIIDSADAVFTELRFWGDHNKDALVNDSYELYSLSALGVKSLDLGYIEMHEEDDFGNQARQRSVLTTDQGAYRMVFDIWFRML